MIREQIWWYLARSAGLLTWITACSSIILGLVMSTRRIGRKLNGPWILDFHRFLSGLTVTFIALHMVALWADSFVTFGWAELLVPGVSEWRPLSVALGVIAFWIILGVEVSSLLKSRIPNRWWHMMHLGSYLVAVLGTAHAITAGSDVDNPIVETIGLVMLTTIIGLTAMRVVEGRQEKERTTQEDGMDRMAKAKQLQAEHADVPAASAAPSQQASSELAPIPVVPARRMAAPPLVANDQAAQAATRSR